MDDDLTPRVYNVAAKHRFEIKSDVIIIVIFYGLKVHVNLHVKTSHTYRVRVPDDVRTANHVYAFHIASYKQKNSNVQPIKWHEKFYFNELRFFPVSMQCMR